MWMKLGICLPVFRHDAETALDTARRAEEAGLDGVFCFDHLFPMGQPERPALSAHPLAAAVGAETSRIAVATFVSRIGVLPDAVLVHSFQTLHRMLGDRLIAGLGVGDRASLPEHEVFGIPMRPVEERLQSLASVCDQLVADGVQVWVGGTAPAIHRLAVEKSVVHNVWDLDPDAFPAGAELTWGGPPPKSGDLAGRLKGVAAGGATWAVVAPPPSADWPAVVEELRHLREGLAR
jgi:alkanesulfonate monooxygenase SsuD/methylene tetrahydromethanopterin reductase-like flavin-dependent oxidoreductase (luciferase family)